MCRIISEWKIGKYVALELDQSPPMRKYNKYRIDGKDYTAVPVYDLPNHIAVESDSSFVGKNIEFV